MRTVVHLATGAKMKPGFKNNIWLVGSLPLIKKIFSYNPSTVIYGRFIFGIKIQTIVSRLVGKKGVVDNFNGKYEYTIY